MSDQESLKCPVCDELLTRPKTLPCRHTLCYSCIPGLLDGASTIQCPVCHKTDTTPGLYLGPHIEISNKASCSSVEPRPCHDCQRNPVIALCLHCHFTLCADCMAKHAAKPTPREKTKKFPDKDRSWSHKLLERVANAGKTIYPVRASENRTHPKESYKQLIGQVKDGKTRQHLTELMEKLTTESAGDNQQQHVLMQELAKIPDESGVLNSELKRLVEYYFPTKPAPAADYLPRNVDYKQKQDIRPTIIGATENRNTRLDWPLSAVYSVPDNAIYIVDTYNYRIMMFDTDGLTGREFYTCEGWITDVAVSDQHILILQPEALHLVNRDGQLTLSVTSFQSNQLLWCCSVQYSNDCIIVLDSDQKCFIFFDSDGDYLRHVRPQPAFNNPQSLAVDGQKRIYITDRGTRTSRAHIKVFTWEAEYIRTFAEAESANMYDIWGVYIDGDGFVSITRHTSNRIDVYGPDFQLVCSYGRPGQDPGCLSVPTSIRLMPDGRAIVTDHRNNRIQLF